MIGTGGIFKWAHLPGWLSHKEVEIVALCDSFRVSAEAAAKDFPDAKVYDDYRELIADPPLIPWGSALRTFIIRKLLSQRCRRANMSFARNRMR
ncbi:hypothetical protein [Cohnella sp. 56]|uniref:hypothetical protein n=1 Tax=Cohnella sp. 56 TaxID=3113722 RepID=UPI00403FCC24